MGICKTCCDQLNYHGNGAIKDDRNHLTILRIHNEKIFLKELNIYVSPEWVYTENRHKSNLHIHKYRKYIPMSLDIWISKHK